MAKSQTQIPGMQYSSGIYVSPGRRTISPALPATYSTYRAIRRHPTVALARGLMAAPIISTDWNVQIDDRVSDDVAVYLNELKKYIRFYIMEKAIFAGIDYGWAGFEIINFLKDGQYFCRMKQLLPELNQVTISESGEFSGYKESLYDSYLPADIVLHIAFRLEGQNLYGQSLLENIRLAYSAYLSCEAGAAKYDAKVAGAQFLVAYPDGESLTADGTIPNATLARDILDGLEAGGGIVRPASQAVYVDQLGADNAKNLGWDISILEDRNARQGSFIDRLNYLDAQMVRGLIMPERSILEGVHGTKAESEAHANMALLYAEYQAQAIINGVNDQIVPRLLEANFGPSVVGKARYEPAPIIDSNREYLRSIYKEVIKDPTSIRSIDVDSVMDQLGVPKSEQVVDMETQNGAVDTSGTEE